MGTDIVPNIFPLFDLPLHYRQERADVALLVELSFISPLRDLYVSILFWGSGIDKVMGNPFLLAELVKLFLKGGAIICLDCLDGERES